MQLLVRGPVVDRRERHAGQRGTEQRHRQDVGVQPEVADDLGSALLEVDGGPLRPLEELGGAHAAVVRAEDDAIRVALGRHLEQHGDVHGAGTSPGAGALSPRRAGVWRP